MEKIAKRLVRLTCILWIIVGVVALVLGFAALLDPAKASSAPTGFVIGFGLLLLSIIVLKTIHNTGKKWAQVILLVLVILGWIGEVFNLINKQQVDLVGLIFYTLPITVVWYFSRQPQISKK